VLCWQWLLLFAGKSVRRLERPGRHSLLEVDHLNQTSTVQYNVQGWTKTVRMSSRTLQLQAFLQTSTKYVFNLLLWCSVFSFSHFLLCCMTLFHGISFSDLVILVGKGVWSVDKSAPFIIKSSWFGFAWYMAILLVLYLWDHIAYCTSYICPSLYTCLKLKNGR